jgi:phytoene dehydrogenase-like protein
VSANHDVIIIGAGLAGLCCAIRLHQADRSVLLLEATDRVGGRVRSDVVDGFVLDHGFQVLLTAYPACRQLLDYDSLELRAFEPGALVRCGGKFSVLGDPWRRPTQAIATALSPVGTFADKIRIAKLRRRSQQGSLADLYERENVTAITKLERLGFTPAMIDQFFRPFLGGVFLDESLAVSSRLLEFVFRMFATGDIAIPAGGMAAIPHQLADQLPEDSIRLSTTVAKLDGRSVRLTDGGEMSADHVVVATESSAAARLLGRDDLNTQWASTTTFYYAADRVPDERKLLILRGDESGPIQTAVVISNVAPEYAPAGKSLISVSVSQGESTDDLEALDASIRAQLRTWFGDGVDAWRRLRIYEVPYALPCCSLEPVLADVEAASFGGAANVFVCGDHRETPSIQGAMNSGLRVADAILSRDAAGRSH